MLHTFWYDIVFIVQVERMIYVHGKQLGLCRDGHLFNHAVPVQASRNQYLVPILSPVTDNLLFLKQRRGKLRRMCIRDSLCETPKAQINLRNGTI